MPQHILLTSQYSGIRDGFQVSVDLSGLAQQMLVSAIGELVRSLRICLQKALQLLIMLFLGRRKLLEESVSAPQWKLVIF